MTAWEPIDAANHREALALAVHPAQEHFVAGHTPLAAIGMAKALVRPGGWHVEPLGLRAGDGLVGFACVCFHMGRPGERRIIHFFIDRRFQGRGYGRAGMEALLSRIAAESPGCRWITLTAHRENLPARALYERLGFVPDGPAEDDELPYRLHLERGLA